MNTKSQQARILRHFEAGHSLTRRSALLDLGIGNLPARVQELRDLGKPIATVRTGRSRFASYRLIP